MTQPTFQELLTSQEARERAAPFKPVEGNGTHFMTLTGTIMNFEKRAIHGFKAVWQGWLQEAAPPPEPRVFRAVAYFNFDSDGMQRYGFRTRGDADQSLLGTDKRVACKRFDLEAIEGVFDD